MSKLRKIRMVDLNLLAAFCPPHQIYMFNMFKIKSTQYLQALESLPEEKIDIDWDDYDKLVPPSMLTEFKQKYEALVVPFPVDNYTHFINVREQEVKQEILEYRKISNKVIEKCMERIKVLDSMPPIELLTLEELTDYYPEVCLDPINRPTFWPHTPEDQPGYVDEMALRAKNISKEKTVKPEETTKQNKTTKKDKK